MPPHCHQQPTTPDPDKSLKSIREVKDQTTRLPLCKLTFFYQGNEGTSFSSERIADDDVLFLDSCDQPNLFVDTMRLNSTFFDAFSRHPVLLWEPAIKAIQNNSIALDVYVWLAYRLHVLTKPVPIRWTRLHQQFGAGFKSQTQFKPIFVANLKLALAVYPDARVTVDQSDGITLHPSAPPIPERQVGCR